MRGISDCKKNLNNDGIGIDLGIKDLAISLMATHTRILIKAK